MLKCPFCGEDFKPNTGPLDRYVACPHCTQQIDMAKTGTVVESASESQPSTLLTQEAFEGGGLVGATLSNGSYLIQEKIGQGGMGAVYRGVQIRLKRAVAVKFLSQTLVGESNFDERFRREACTLATLTHPHIVPVIDTGQEGDLHYIIMNYLVGPEGRPASLRDVMDQGKMPSEYIFKLILQACSALQFAHENGIIHRDVKPGNFLIDKNGDVHLADFGLASTRGIVGDNTLTTLGTTLGTFRYMSPEQRDNPITVDGRADIFSLGIVLYEMLTGDIPQMQADPPSKVRPDIPAAIDGIIKKSVQNKPENRYNDLNEMAADLERALAVNESDSATDLAPSPPKKASFGFYGVCLVLVVLGAFLTYDFASEWMDKDPKQAKNESVVEDVGVPPNQSTDDGEEDPVVPTTESKNTTESEANAEDTGPVVASANEPSREPPIEEVPSSQPEEVNTPATVQQPPAQIPPVTITPPVVEGWTPLHEAAEQGNLDDIKTALANGADINAQAAGDDENTPLHVAAKANQKAAVQLLLDSNANKNLKNYDAWTAYNLAQRKGYSDIADMIAGHGWGDIRSNRRE